MTEIDSTTVQYAVSGLFPRETYSRQIIAIDSETWPVTAFYEEDWFSGKSVTEALRLMKTKDRMIILEWNVASRLNKKVGDAVAVTIGSSTLTLEIVGFFGHELPQEYLGQAFPSYIPLKLYESLKFGLTTSHYHSDKVEA